MTSEILLKDYIETKNYYQEMALVEKTGVLELVKRSLDFKKKNASTRISKEGKYFAEIIWPLKKEGNKAIFENVISLLPNTKKETLTVMGSFSQELNKEEWSNKEILKKAIREAFKNPSPRSNQKFYNDPA
jgi:DNA-directed RNA polymerase subunit F